MFEGPEKKFQRHIADYLIRQHQYAVLEQYEITDTEYFSFLESDIGFYGLPWNKKANANSAEEHISLQDIEDIGDVNLRYWGRP